MHLETQAALCYTLELRIQTASIKVQLQELTEKTSQCKLKKKSHKRYLKKKHLKRLRLRYKSKLKHRNS
jgi:hypothetical protein